MAKEISGNGSATNEWERQRNSLKTMWVVSVLFFWITVAIQLGVYLLRAEISLILVSIILGMMILGVALKLRYQRHLQSDPSRLEAGGGD